MVGFHWLNRLSVKAKLTILLALPLSLAALLSFSVFSSLEKQLASLQTIKGSLHFVESMSSMYGIAHDSRSTNSFTSLDSIHDQQLNLIPAAFPSQDATFVQESVDELFEIAQMLTETTDILELSDLSEWLAGAYTQLFFMLEKEPINSGIAVVEGHYKALLELNWLRFWAAEENWSLHILIDEGSTFQNEAGTLAEFHNTLTSFIENQQLYINRFVALNADATQVDLLLETFTNPAFQQSFEFRQALLESTELSLDDEAKRLGFLALDKRLDLIAEVASVIESQLSEEVETLVNQYEFQQRLFLIGLALLSAVTVFVGISLSKRIANKLSDILAFLENIEHTDKELIPLTVDGSDELSTFSMRVNTLAEERIESQQRIFQSKEEAIAARDKAELASKAKSSFLANMSHEIRTPLNGVIGISEVLSETDLSATQKDYVDTIETSSQLLLSLINDILDFSKIESGMLLISHHQTLIRESLFDIAAIVAPKVAEKELSIEVDVSSDFPYRIMVDDHRLRQVLMNFMSNAVKFTEKGGVTLGAKVLDLNGNIAMLRFSVTDSGIGIDADKQDKIFNAFAQEDDSTTRQFGGTGLGLAISTELIELMGGRIQLNSEKGRGSTFFFDLELEIIDSHHVAVGDTSTLSVHLMGEPSTLRDKLIDELNFYDIEIKSILRDPSELSSDDPVDAIVLVQEDIESAISHCGTLKNAHPTLPICLVRSYHQKQYDYGSEIQGLIGYPLLGNRLVKAIRSASTKLMHAASNIDSGKASAVIERRALLVEDNPVNQKVATVNVHKLGYECDIANNGLEAVNMFKENPSYAFILMDCMMPVLDGFEATKQIREQEAKLNAGRIPIIAMTASVIDDDIQRCFDVGMDEYVPKPFKADFLKDKVERLIKEEIPVVWSPSAQKNKPDAPSASAQPSKPGIKILLVEDNKINQKVASMHLQNAGYAYDIANDGQEAVDAIVGGNKYSLILMDCMMPNKDGFEATADIRGFEVENRLERVPIIALTASVIDDDIQRCFDMGMDEYLSKPVKRDNLIDKIVRYVEA